MDQQGSFAATKLRIGDIVGKRYRVVRSIGRGASGHVWEGLDESAHRRLAIKVLHPEYIGRRDLVERVEQEARIATGLESANVVRVLDLGTLPDARPFVVMELWDGEDLGQRMARAGVLDAKEAAIIGVQILKGLSDAHAAGIIHRDVKPANVVLARTISKPVAKLGGLGMSKLGGSRYQSPEQCRGERTVDARSDVYSLAVVLYEAVTGRMPHDAGSLDQLMSKIALHDCPDVRTHRPDLDPEFADALMVALQREAGHRFRDADEFRGELNHVLANMGVPGGDWRGPNETAAAGDPPATSRSVPAHSVKHEPPRAAQPTVAISIAPDTPPPSSGVVGIVHTHESAHEDLTPRRPLAAVVMLSMSVVLFVVAVRSLPVDPSSVTAARPPGATASSAVVAAAVAPVAPGGSGGVASAVAVDLAPAPAPAPAPAASAAASADRVSEQAGAEPRAGTVVTAPDAGKGAVEVHTIRTTF